MFWWLVACVYNKFEVRIMVFEFYSIAITWSVSQFCTSIPTPPEGLGAFTWISLLLKLNHLYPEIWITLSTCRWVSVIHIISLFIAFIICFRSSPFSKVQPQTLMWPNLIVEMDRGDCYSVFSARLGSGVLDGSLGWGMKDFFTIRPLEVMRNGLPLGIWFKMIFALR